MSKSIRLLSSRVAGGLAPYGDAVPAILHKDFEGAMHILSFSTA